MSTKYVKDFVKNWEQVQVNEIAAAQSHFNDICALVGHDPPIKADPRGKFLRFEQPTQKAGGARGRADVWYAKKFIWEYKGVHANLDKAYQQLLLYRESLGNPPLLITSDLRRIIIHTNFTNTVKRVYEIDFDRLLDGDGLNLLQRAFYDPESFEPDQTQAQVTQISARTFVKVAETLQTWARVEDRREDPERLAHFIIRLLFALFAEDMGLLPENVFTQLVKHQKGDLGAFSQALKGLFAAMRDGGLFGFHQIPYFNGGLFDDDYVPDLPGDIIYTLKMACDQDWAGIDPSIFGTLFERIIDESKRAQLGAHYTSREDIMLIVEPVLMEPLRREWQEIKGRSQTSEVLETSEVLNAFSDKIAATRVLDPACGSGNFLYVALRQLLDLQKEVITFAGRLGLPDIPLTVGPEQLYGIEINSYAHELAQITVWIGYLQWRFENGFAEITEPILRPLKNIERKDAILDLSDPEKPKEPEWPEAEVIIGNPPFLGGKKIRAELNNDVYVNALLSLYGNRLHGESDLVCYWFEKSREHIEQNEAKRAGLLATNSIRGSFNRGVLERIKSTGDIFMAWSDRPWILDGAAVRVSILGFDDSTEQMHTLNGNLVDTINPDLSSQIDITQALKLVENKGISFQGINKVGPFDFDVTLANEMLLDKSNPNGKPNSDVVKPIRIASDITKRSRNKWIIDFGTSMSIEEASNYILPISYVRELVKPQRDKVRRKTRREKWWLFGETCPAMRKGISPFERYIVTPAVSKFRLYVWLDKNIIPDHRLIVIAREDDYFFGVLHSKLHELWSLGKGGWVGKGNDPSYTPSSTFETFPFPWPPGEEPQPAQEPGSLKEPGSYERVAAIAEAARQLVAHRQGWLHPPEAEIGITISERMLKKRTLTNMYNALVHYRTNVKGRARNPRSWQAKISYIGLDEIETLDHIHTTLDNAVLDAYGWPHNLSDEGILERLLALNLERHKRNNP